MKNNNKIVDELIGENPELKDKKKHLSEAIKVLKSINPQIKAPQKFKKDLKKRLTNIIQHKKNTYIKKRYYHIFIPIFATSFAVFGFFYFLPGTLFQQENETPIIQNVNNKVSEESVQRDIQEIIDKIIEEKNIQEEEVNRVGVEKKIQQNIISEGGAKAQLKNQVRIESDIGETEKNNDEIAVEKIGVSSSDNVEKEVTDNTPVIQQGELENTQLIDLFGGGESKDQGISRGSQASESDMIGNDFSGLFGDLGGEGDLSEDFDEGLVLFEDFCETEGGEIIENDEEKICRKDKKECHSGDYENGTCEFQEIK
ncbi:hypothetical protein A9Q91_05390 [Candidatus Gracilibacteria bacterium 28_42_T64]|nr:hypothetical protein A9Q91_05390 [Candidatus Gracilibacteria bacterium 28_42_T64]